ncbi:MAG: hypothetical protein WC717_00695 [Candidatus Micrarchaeia archaeon]|jgi:hypothetical protein
MERVLPLLAICALLLPGCASEPRPNEGMQGQVVQNAVDVAGQVLPQAPPATPPEGGGLRANCTLAVGQGTVIAGEEVEFSLNASFPGSARIEVKCGNRTRHLQSEGTLVIEEKCRLGEPGTHNITVSVDGRECASAIVEARKMAGGECSIDNATVVRDFSSYTYVWAVAFGGFSDGDTMTWACDNTVAKKAIRGDPVLGMPLYEILSCDFPGEPRGDYINVSISGVQCGQVYTRQE